MLRRKKYPKKTNQALITDRTPFAFNESFKSLRTNLEFSTFDGELKVILFTSSIPDEGKSSLVINSAKTFAESGHKVLIIDGDLRSPTLGRYLRVRRDVREGLSTVLSRKATIADAIYSYPVDGYDVMLSGPIPPNPTELFAHKRTEALFKTLKETYDYIFIDSPPVGIVSDAVTISKYVDGAVFVVRHNFANKDMIKDSLKKLKASKVKILGAIVNDYDFSKDLNVSSSYEYQYQYRYNPPSQVND